MYDTGIVRSGVGRGTPLAVVARTAGLGLDLEGLAWSTTVCAWLNLALLLPGLRSRLGLPPSRERVLSRLTRIALAAGASTGLAFGVWLAFERANGSLALLGLCILLSVVLYGAFSHLLALEEWRELLSRVRKRAAG